VPSKRRITRRSFTEGDARMKIPRLWAAIGAGLAIGTITAFAQTAPHPGPGLGLATLVEIEGALNLSAAQKAQFDIATAATRDAFGAAHARHEHMKAVVDAEMAKARPDLAALANLQESEMEAGRAVHVATRGEWLKLYNMLDDTQAAVVKAFLQERLMRLDTIRENPDARGSGKWG
jgi:hypothetical protein